MLTVAVFWGMFPILVNKGTQHIQPLFFAGSSAFLAAAAALGVSVLRRETGKIFDQKTLFLGLLVALTIVAFPYALMFLSLMFENGAEMLPSLQNYWPYVVCNGVLLMTFPIFGLLFLAVFYNEQPNFFQILGVFIVVTGAFFTSRSRRFPPVSRPDIRKCT